MDNKLDFSGKTILLIDDDEIIHILVEEYLKDTNVELLVSKSGKEGIKLFNENYVDLIILDLHMPEINGYDVLKEIKKIDKHVDVVMCTSDDQYHKSTYDEGAIAYIVKPLLYDTFTNIINMVLKLKKVL
jgi:DNA-binding NtrC family response regulator